MTTNNGAGSGFSVFGSSSPYVVICDAGSTGTRLYVYNHKGSRGGGLVSSSSSSSASSSSPSPSSLDVAIQVGRKVKPGLSEQEPSSVVDYLVPSLVDAATRMVPPEYHAETPLFVYATGGMRMLPQQQQDDLFDELVKGLLLLNNNNNNVVVPFLIERDNFRTIDGSDEGYYAALAVNYLAGRLGSDLRPLPQQQQRGDDGNGIDYLDATGPSILGALDLGGASAQIVFHAPKDHPTTTPGSPPSLRKSTPVMHHHRGGGGNNNNKVRREDFYSKSLLGYGSEPVRDGLDSYVLAQEEEAQQRRRGNGKKEATVAVVSNPCYFKGYEKERNNATHTGTGDGKKCMQSLDVLIENQMTKHGENNNRHHHGDPLGPNHPPVRGDFYATTLYYYTIDFVRNVLEDLIRSSTIDETPREDYVRVRKLLAVSHPSLGSLNAATQIACGWKYQLLQEHRSAYSELTSPEKMPHRCLELSYIVVLLQKLGFFHDEQNRVHFVNVIRNQTAEWTLGAFLHITNNNNNNNNNNNGRNISNGYRIGQRSSNPQTTNTPVVSFLLLLVAGFVVSVVARNLLHKSKRILKRRKSDDEKSVRAAAGSDASCSTASEENLLRARPVFGKSSAARLS